MDNEIASPQILPRMFAECMFTVDSSAVQGGTVQGGTVEGFLYF